MRTLDVRLSPAARQALARRGEGLVVELELLFSCLVRKQVRFPVRPPAGSYPLESAEPKVTAHFHPIVRHHCRLDEIQGEQATDDLPLANPTAFMPRWLKLDYSDGVWSGDFGYARDS